MMRHLIPAVLGAAVLSAGAVRAQQSVPATPPRPPAAGAPPATTQTQAPAARGESRAPATRKEERDSLEPAVDTSAASAAPSASSSGGSTAAPGDAPSTAAVQASEPPKSGKAMDHLQLGTTDITGNRELPKVLYIVPWKRPDLGDLTGKPLNSLVDEALQPIDRDVFKRENRYYGAVTRKGSGAGAAQAGTATGTSRSGARPPAPASGDER